MHILIGSEPDQKRYDFSALNKASLLDLIELKKQTGLTMGAVGELYAGVVERSGEPGYDLIGDDGALMLFAVMIWLSRRADGDLDLPFRESASMPLSELQIVADDSDDEDGERPEEPDPSSPRRGSGRAASGARATSGRSRSTTSRRRSTSTS